MDVTYLAHFSYRRRYRIHLQLELGLNTALSTDRMHWPLKQSFSQSHKGVVIKFIIHYYSKIQISAPENA